MALSKEDILNAIAEMSVMDVVDLVSAMEEKFGVTAAAAVAAAAASPLWSPDSVGKQPMWRVTLAKVDTGGGGGSEAAASSTPLPPPSPPSPVRIARAPPSRAMVRSTRLHASIRPETNNHRGDSAAATRREVKQRASRGGAELTASSPLHDTNPAVATANRVVAKPPIAMKTCSIHRYVERREVTTDSAT